MPPPRRDTIAAENRVFAYGAGHSALAAQDVVSRGGGLAVITLLAAPGAASRVITARPPPR
ncbi:SIS domain-containing protein [Streptomyces sp. P38-E01]|uniref:SIS domain-containing protein n=1 Tax=Streptomyces tardus TaxID=2780544 RepID=A0A949JGZ9_9ACTN|nr:SIS domain-containing protein [Streptomyces tardus]